MSIVDWMKFRPCPATVGVIALCVVVAGCVSPPAPRTIEDSFAYEGEFDVIWGGCIYTLMVLELPIETLDKDARVVGTEWIDFFGAEQRDYCDCGKWWPAGQLGRAGRVTLSVQSSGSRHEVTVTSEFVQATGYPSTGPFGPTGFQVQCVSTGRLEREIEAVLTRSVRRHYENQEHSETEAP